MTNEKKYQLEFIGGKLLNSLEKVIREKNAKKFITTLNKTFSKEQTENLINLLSKYEKFLKLND